MLMKLLEKYSNKPWDWEGISQNPNITVDFIEKHPDFYWDWYGISVNSNINIEKIIEKYPNKNWNWYSLSQNPNITASFIEANIEKPWDWDSLSQNPNITMEIIEKFPNKPWNWNAISYNKFQLHPILQRRKKEKIKQILLKQIPQKYKEFETAKNQLNYNICIDFIKMRGRDFQNGKRNKMI